ncbi:carbohydrate ABC transporter substrate-binding protein (CUT1 family) [Labedella gwakjiensis]|uniref:Carbohydrate ABC transporter substrate-binding protein (CUT1 family) n=1 Tax=Labedella gwakjiensis TaxID=390269 RepID=A0A2P8GVM3_9MICO|nr:extracellular solute-binding protein [Labedella gwakjiensis]PSL38005.1 carbohydrate ABC transporter substrate-binding protein (CUT1 family) [Labedella gwakjiensis]RUQ87432.1 extracellular solute-binding protein [Labedella gwakjiensis]
MKHSKKITGAALLAASALVLSGCSGSSSGGEDDNVLTLWHFESETSAMGIAWDEAIKTFEEETGATVEFEAKAFEQIRSTASQVLNSDEAPDILEYNKGNATAGLLASQGLLSSMDDAYEEYGWADKLAPSLQTTARYDESGIMGSGSYYGVPNYGEFVEVYYNVDMFEEAGLEIPTTIDEFEDVMQAFVDEGVTPLAESAAEYPLGQLWYQLALSKADRDWVDAYQLYTDDVDFEDEQISYATETVKDWTDKGYISADATGLKAEDAGTSFINGTYPIFFSGSWWHNRFTTEISDFDFGTFLFPESEMAPGSAGNMWVIPERAQNKDLAAEFIDITMRPEIQALIGNNGGVPVAADPADITDEKSAELIANFNTLTERDGLAFYPDWPTATFYDDLNAGLQELLNGTLSPAEVQQQLGEKYQSGVDDIVG